MCMNESKEATFNRIENVIGRCLTPDEKEYIENLISQEEWQPMAIEIVVNYLVIDSGKRFNLRYFDKLIEMCSDNGCKSFDSVQAYFYNGNHMCNDEETYRRIAETLEMSGELTTTQNALISKWLTMHSIPVIIEACRRTVYATNRNRFIYADHILKNWHSEGIKTLDELSIWDNKMRQEIAERNERVRKSVQSNQQYIAYQNNPLVHKISEEVMKPCPFCGGEDILLQSQFSARAQAYYRMVTCNTCNAKTRAIKDDAATDQYNPGFWNTTVVNEVKILWNKRV